MIQVIYSFVCQLQHCGRSLSSPLGMVLGAGLVLLALFVSLDRPAPRVHAQGLPELNITDSGARGRVLRIGRAYLDNAAEGQFLRDPSNPAAPKFSITLPELLPWVQTQSKKQFSNTVQSLGNGIWLLDTSIVIEDNGRLDITSASGVKELRLVSRPDAAYNLIADGGWLNIDGVKVYSWDNSPGVDSYDTTYLPTDSGVMQTRSYLLALEGGRMDLQNAELMYLGFAEINDRVGYGKGEPSGLAWRLLPPGVTDHAAGPKGSIVKSKVHHNYFGMYSYQAVGLVISGTEVFDNYFYGLDPHDDSYGFVVANNYIHDNGYTGLIFSRRCISNTVYGNRIEHNGSHGFMLDRGSNHNLIYDNEISDNKYDGMVIYQSSDNQIYDNVVKNSGRYGIRIAAEFDDQDVFDDVAADNVIRNNVVSNSTSHGIYLLDRADRNWVLDNQVTNNGGAGIVVKTGLITLQGNTVRNNLRDGLLLEEEVYTGGTNPGGPSKPPLGAPARDNQIHANRFLANGQNGIEINGGGANQIGSLGAGNLISGNLTGGLVVRRSDASVISSNEIYANTAANGAGISASCTISNPVTHTLFNNVIVGNTTTDLKGRGAGLYIGNSCRPVVNNNWIYNNRNAGVDFNVQNANAVGSPDIDATNNVWATSDSAAIENMIWHINDDGQLGRVNFLPVSNAPVDRPPTPSPTATFTPVANPTATPTFTPTPAGTLTPGETPTPTNTPTPTTVGSETQANKAYLPLIQR